VKVPGISSNDAPELDITLFKEAVGGTGIDFSERAIYVECKIWDKTKLTASQKNLVSACNDGLAPGATELEFETRSATALVPPGTKVRFQEIRKVSVGYVDETHKLVEEQLFIK
jgi:hypothetical protein